MGTGAATQAELLRYAVLLPLLVICSVEDWRRGRIPNRAVLAGLAGGFAAAILVAPAGLEGLWWSLGGMALGGALLLPFYAVRLLGAGDVKLMAAIGSVVGWAAVLPVVAWSLVMAAVLSLLIALASGVARQALGNVRESVWKALILGSAGERVQRSWLPATTGTRSPHALAIAAGVVLQAVLG